MPFQSAKQMRFMFSQHPDIAKKWEDKYGVSKDVKKQQSKYMHLMKGKINGE